MRSALPPAFAISVRAIPGPESHALAPLFPDEEAAVARAIPARRAEFAAGRAAARAALGRLGKAPCPLPVGPGRAPVWPLGVLGSLTHAAGVAMAVVGPSTAAAGLGLDAEPDADLPADLAEAVLMPSEAKSLTGRRDGLRCARRIFCAKEAVFKALFPLTGIWAGFEAAEVLAPPPETGTAHVRLCRPFGARLAGIELSVAFAFGGGLLMAVVVLPPGIIDGVGEQ